MVFAKKTLALASMAFLLACALLALTACASQPGASASTSSGSAASEPDASTEPSPTAAATAPSSETISSAAAATAPSSEATEEPSSQDSSSAKPSILYQGHASVRIVTPEGKVIYIDPYAGEDEWYDLAADLILITHGHYDHSGLERIANRNADCRVITQVEALAEGEHSAIDLGFAKVTPVQAGFNDNHDVAECVGYVIELTDGKKVYLSGDTSTTDDMRNGVLADMGIDYAFWCADGVYNMGNEEAAAAAAMVGAAHNIPYHNSPADSGNTFDVEAAHAFNAPNAMIVQPGEEIDL